MRPFPVDAGRIGAVSYLNALPLISGIESLVRVAPPAALAEELYAGKLDVAMVPVHEAFIHPGYSAVNGVSIASDGDVFSVTVFSNPMAGDGSGAGIPRRIWLDPDSRTSCLLAKVLFGGPGGCEFLVGEAASGAENVAPVRIVAPRDSVESVESAGNGAGLSPKGAGSHSPGQAAAPPWVPVESASSPVGAASQTAYGLPPIGSAMSPTGSRLVEAPEHRRRRLFHDNAKASAPPRPGEGVLRIGNPAIQMRIDSGPGIRAIDLGRVWKRTTGKPFVYALWLIRPGFPRAAETAQALRAAAQRGAGEREAIAAAQTWYPPGLASRYLHEHIDHRCEERHWGGLTEFRERAIATGLLPPDTALPERI